MTTRATYKTASTPAQREGPILKHTFEGHEDIIKNLIFLHDHIHIEVLSGKHGKGMVEEYGHWLCHRTARLLHVGGRTETFSGGMLAER